MTWLATLHGDTSHLDGDHSAQLEGRVRDALASVAGELVELGHVGVAATFHGDSTGDVNLLAPGETPDAGPQPAESSSGEAPPPQLEIPRDTAEPPADGDTSADVELTPGQALAPTTPEPDPDAVQGHPGELSGDQASEA